MANPNHEQKRKRAYNKFIFKNIGRALIYFAVILGIYFLFKYVFSDGWQEILAPVTSKPLLMYLVFFLSETFFGIIPPEFFVIWSVQPDIWIYSLKVALLAVISFVGGAVIAFSVGKMLKDSPIIRRFAQKFFLKYERYYKRFGGIIIVLSALTPLPYATISLISGLFDFSATRFYLFASTRFIRFLIYGFLFYKI